MTRIAQSAIPTLRVAARPDEEEIIKRVSNQLSNDLREHRDTSVDVGGQYELARLGPCPG